MVTRRGPAIRPLGCEQFRGQVPAGLPNAGFHLHTYLDQLPRSCLPRRGRGSVPFAKTGLRTILANAFGFRRGSRVPVGTDVAIIRMAGARHLTFLRCSDIKKPPMCLGGLSVLVLARPPAMAPVRPPNDGQARQRFRKLNRIGRTAPGIWNQANEVGRKIPYSHNWTPITLRDITVLASATTNHKRSLLYCSPETEEPLARQFRHLSDSASGARVNLNCV